MLDGFGSYNQMGGRYVSFVRRGLQASLYVLTFLVISNTFLLKDAISCTGSLFVYPKKHSPTIEFCDSCPKYEAQHVKVVKFAEMTIDLLASGISINGNGN
jgi:hypothetical protein